MTISHNGGVNCLQGCEKLFKYFFSMPMLNKEDRGGLVNRVDSVENGHVFIYVVDY